MLSPLCQPNDVTKIKSQNFFIFPPPQSKFLATPVIRTDTIVKYKSAFHEVLAVMFMFN